MSSRRPGAQVLVTGASGLLGSNLVLELCGRGYEVAAASHSVPIQGEGILSLQADLSEPGAAADLVERISPSCVVHCAALTDVDRCEDHPDEAEKVNVGLSRGVAEGAATVGSQIIYISTDSVFDGRRGGYTEEDPPAPLNQYALSKLRGEEAVREVLPEAIILRTNIFGWGARVKPSLAEWMLGRLESGAGFRGFRDVVFNPLFVNDLCAIVVRLMERPLQGVVHVGCAEPCSKYQFGRRLAEAFGLDPDLAEPSSSDHAEHRAPRPKDTSLSTERASLALGIDMPDLTAGLGRFRRFRDEGSVVRLRRLTGGESGG